MGQRSVAARSKQKQEQVGELARLMNCPECGCTYTRCEPCSRSVTCSKECSQLRRRRQVRLAGSRYQQSERGAQAHAIRQRNYRQRQEQVTHTLDDKTVFAPSQQPHQAEETTLNQDEVVASSAQSDGASERFAFRQNQSPPTCSRCGRGPFVWYRSYSSLGRRRSTRRRLSLNTS